MIASITKVFTAALMYAMEERGIVLPTDHLVQYMKDWPVQTHTRTRPHTRIRTATVESESILRICCVRSWCMWILSKVLTH